LASYRQTLAALARFSANAAGVSCNRANVLRARTLPFFSTVAPFAMACIKDYLIKGTKMNDKNVDTKETNELIASNKVEGTAVYNPQGENLGKIHNFMVNKQSGKVDYAVLQFGGVMGIGSDYYPLPWDKLSYDMDKGGYVVALDKSQLDNAPRYGDAQEPVHDSAYRDKVYSYYGSQYLM